MSTHYKYPRTYHCPWSLGATDDDKTLKSMDHFEGKEVVVTIKMDGENSTIYHGGYTHARSVDSKQHESRDWLKQLASNVAFNIPDGWRVCGENLYAKHSIAYNHLNTYFNVFSVWNDKNEALSWDDTVEWVSLIFEADITVPVIYRGVYDADKIKEAFEAYQSVSEDECEGYVIRVASSFDYKDFSKCLAKYVRANHVQSDKHWTTNWTPNNIKA